MLALFQFTLYDLLTPGGVNPAFWACPIQDGVPTLLSLAKTLLILFAGVAFFIGILIAVFNYLTAYGDENKIKKGREALKWTFIGGGLVLFSAVIITWAAGAFLGKEDSASLNVLTNGGIQLQGRNSSGDTDQLGKGSNCVSETPTTKEETTNTTDVPADDKKVIPANTETDTENQIYQPGQPQDSI